MTKQLLTEQLIKIYQEGIDTIKQMAEDEFSFSSIKDKLHEMNLHAGLCFTAASRIEGGGYSKRHNDYLGNIWVEIFYKRPLSHYVTIFWWPAAFNVWTVHEMMDALEVRLNYLKTQLT